VQHGAAQRKYMQTKHVTDLSKIMLCCVRIKAS
jgi:SUMO ligase MMS21 Smc5/6 complex component